MKKYILSTILAVSTIFSAQSAFAQDDAKVKWGTPPPTMTKEEAKQSLNQVIVDIKTIKDELDDLEQIAKEGQPENLTQEQRTDLIQRHQQDVSDIEELSMKTYTVNGKTINFLNNTGRTQIILSDVDGDVLNMDAWTVPASSDYKISPATSADSYALLPEVQMAQKFVNEIAYYYESVNNLLDIEYEPYIKTGAQLDTSNREDLKRMLTSNIKNMDAIMKLLHENYNLALLSANGTTNQDTVAMYNIRYKLNRDFVEKIAQSSYVDGYNFLIDNKEIKLSLSNNTETMKGADITRYTLGNSTDLGKLNGAYGDFLLVPYNEAENAFYYAQGYRQQFAGYLEKLDPNAVISEELTVNIDATEKNKEEAINSLVALNSDLQKIIDLLKKNKDLAYKSYTDYEGINRMDLNETYETNKKKIGEIANSLTYNRINLLDGSFQKMVVYTEVTGSGNEWTLYDYNPEVLDLSYGIETASNAKVALSQTDKIIKITESRMVEYSTWINYFNNVGTYGRNYLVEDFNKLITVTERQNLYTAAHTNNMTNSTISPQTVKAKQIIRVVDNYNWILIDTYAGPRWIKTKFFIEGEKELVETKIETLKRLHLHDNPTEEAVTNATVAPQKLYSPYKVGEWYAVNTWLGVKYVKPDFVEEDFNAYLTNTERLYLHNTADNKSKISATVSPQTLKVLNRNGEFLQIQTWLGPKYIKPTKDSPNRIVSLQVQTTLMERVYLHTLPDASHKTGATVSPQIVNIKAELSGTNWIMIQTWLGDRWIQAGKYICNDGSLVYDLSNCPAP